MLIQFKVSNFRSVGEEQILNLQPSNNQKEFQSNILVEDRGTALNMVALYGANGSGKSNVLNAFGEFLSMIKNSSKSSSTTGLRFDPFLLREGWADKPTIFEMIFVVSGIRYRYGFSYDEKSIHTEWLYKKHVGREVNVFKRKGDIIEPTASLKANVRIIDAAIEATRDNSLFLATLDILNVDLGNVIFKYFQKNMMLDGHHNYNFGSMVGIWESDLFMSQVTGHLKRMKLGLVDVNAKKTELKSESTDPEYKVMASHRYYDKDGQPTGEMVSWDFTERESSGSIKALELAGPFAILLVAGGLLVIDEIEAKMHPLLTLDFINLFLNKATNPNNAQLIFSTHDTNLLSYATLRRDQIYFAEKNSWESTEIYSLSDFIYVNEGDGSESKERPDTDKEKRYIEGRYGAVPVFGTIGNYKKVVNG